MASVRDVRRTEVVNMRTSPKAQTTVERRAMLRLTVPADRIWRVSCKKKGKGDVEGEIGGFFLVTAVVDVYHKGDKGDINNSFGSNSDLVANQI